MRVLLLFCLILRVNWNYAATLKTFLNGLETYIHREIIFDDPKTLWDAFYLAKFYEERWKNPFGENSKPKLPSHNYQIQIQKRFSTEIPYQSQFQISDSAFQAKIQIQGSIVEQQKSFQQNTKLEAEIKVKRQNL
ncbi:hypothetical protein AAHE18_12G139300 [Arachis hypogaea]